MPPASPPLDEHGFPIPPSFDGHVSRRGIGQVADKALKVGLVLVFIALLAGWLINQGLPTGAKQFIARQLVSRAIEKYNLGDAAGALADLDRAVSWLPDEPQIYELRAELKLSSNDFSGSLQDFDELIRLSPGKLSAYQRRSYVFQRLDRHHEAIDDLTTLVRLIPNEPLPRNNRAYARALANVELDEALIDVEEALKMVEKDIASGHLLDQDPSELTTLGTQKAAYLDTRGYIYFLQEKYEPALADLNQAIEMIEESRKPAMPRGRLLRPHLEQNQTNHDLAVMYHHRGQVLQKLGRAAEAQSDLDQGDRFGYNPANGVF